MGARQVERPFLIDFNLTKNIKSKILKKNITNK